MATASPTTTEASDASLRRLLLVVQGRVTSSPSVSVTSRRLRLWSAFTPLSVGTPRQLRRLCARVRMRPPPKPAANVRLRSRRPSAGMKHAGTDAPSLSSKVRSISSHSASARSERCRGREIAIRTGATRVRVRTDGSAIGSDSLRHDGRNNLSANSALTNVIGANCLPRPAAPRRLPRRPDPSVWPGHFGLISPERVSAFMAPTREGMVRPGPIGHAELACGF
jgi:hypothetical protein